MKRILLCAAALLGLTSVNWAAPAFINEYNAGGATVVGDWFEVVVVGAGIAGSVVDMRGWEFRVSNSPLNDGQQQQQGLFKLSQNSYWGNVQAGTIITFFKDDASTPAPRTSILGMDRFSSEGWGHTNIQVSDPTFIDVNFLMNDGDYPVDENFSQFAIFDKNSNLVFGPAGEGHAGYPGSGVKETEVFKLEANPSPLITLASPYNDGTTSTFGAPNQWTTNMVTNVQDFSAFAIPEPGSISMLILGGVLFAYRRQRGKP